MQGDLNCAHMGCRWDYAQPLNKDLGTADNKLEHFLESTSGHFYAQQEHTWKGKECRAALDHVLTWNYHLPPQISKPIPKSHKKFDHCQIWTQLPHLDFPKQANTARTTQPDFSQRIDTVFFKRHVDSFVSRGRTRTLHRYHDTHDTRNVRDAQTYMPTSGYPFGERDKHHIVTWTYS